MNGNSTCKIEEESFASWRARSRPRATVLLLAWFVTWIAFALTPNLAVHAQGKITSAAPAVVIVMAQYSTEMPDAQCVDGSVFDGIADLFEVAGSLPVVFSPYRPRPIPLVANGLDAAGGVRPTSLAARALALPLQGHMTRLRI
ncbi:MAG: hypothetical protein ACKVQQ_23535 [Burkholderiales bacterium]